MGAYAASKHAFEALSDSLRRELFIYGIDVIVIEPGTVSTPIIEKFEDYLDAYKSTDYSDSLTKLVRKIKERKKIVLTPESVA